MEPLLSHLIELDADGIVKPSGGAVRIAGRDSSLESRPAYRSAKIDYHQQMQPVEIHSLAKQCGLCERQLDLICDAADHVLALSESHASNRRIRAVYATLSSLRGALG